MIRGHFIRIGTVNLNLFGCFAKKITVRDYMVSGYRGSGSRVECLVGMTELEFGYRLLGAVGFRPGISLQNTLDKPLEQQLHRFGTILGHPRPKQHAAQKPE